MSNKYKRNRNDDVYNNNKPNKKSKIKLENNDIDNIDEFLNVFNEIKIEDKKIGCNNCNIIKKDIDCMKKDILELKKKIDDIHDILFYIKGKFITDEESACYFY